MTTYNPNGNNWANSDNMGKQLLLKAGWSTGEGVGKNKQGTNIHIKVSIKNEKEGIGLKSEKRGNDLSLMQCFTFDNLLKTKYCNQTENVNNDDALIERGLSRSRYGRAVPKEFFKPVNNDEWNKILCKTEIEKVNEVSQVSEIAPPEASSNNNFISSHTIYEYFALKMKNKNSGIDPTTFAASKINTLEKYLNDITSSDDIKNGIKRKNDSTNEIGGKKQKLNEDVIDSETKVEKKRKSKKIENNSLENISIDIQMTENNTEKKSKKRKKNEASLENSNKIIEDNCKISKKTKKSITDVGFDLIDTEFTSDKDKKKSKKSKKTKIEIELNESLINSSEIEEIKISNKKSKKEKIEEINEIKSKNHSDEPESINIPKKKKKSKTTTVEKNVVEEITECNISKNEIIDVESNIDSNKAELIDVPKKKKKSKKEKSISNEKSDQMDSDTQLTTKYIPCPPEICDGNDNNDHSPIEDISTSAIEVFETERICPWDTSNVHHIAGYKYY